MVMPGDEHISCTHELSFWALHTVTIASQSMMTGMFLTRYDFLLTNITMLSRFPARFFSLAISLPLRPVSPIWIMRALEAARTTRGDACTVISKYISNDCRALKLFHVPSTTHAALPSSTFNKNYGT